MSFVRWVVVVVICGLLVGCSDKKVVRPDSVSYKLLRSKSTTVGNYALSFHKDGLLSLISSSGTKIIDVAYERANTPEKRAQGLMYRTVMQEQQSMLFVFDDVAPRYFYMKNTYIPLDILFLDNEKKVVKIYNNAQPGSEELLPSFTGAHYALEVCAGFCQRHGIGEGDLVSW